MEGRDTSELKSTLTFSPVIFAENHEHFSGKNIAVFILSRLTFQKIILTQFSSNLFIAGLN